MATREEKVQKVGELRSEIEDVKKETHEGKLTLVEDLKTQINDVKNELFNRKQKLRKFFLAGTFLRTGIVLLLVAIGVGIVAYFL